MEVPVTNLTTVLVALLPFNPECIENRSLRATRRQADYLILDQVPARSVPSQQLLPKGEVLQEEFFSGTKDGDDPDEQVSKAHKNQGIIAKGAPGRCASKSLILGRAEFWRGTTFTSK